MKLLELYHNLFESAYPVSDKAAISAAILDIRKLGYINPLNSREIVINNSVSIEISNWDGALWFSSIYSMTRGAGNASAVVKQMCDIADKHGVVIRGSVKPFGDKKGLTSGQLLNWYKRFGFVKIDYGMIQRMPK